MASAFHSLRNGIYVNINIKCWEQIHSVWVRTKWIFTQNACLKVCHCWQKRKSWCYDLQSPAKPGFLYLNSIYGISTNHIFLISWEDTIIFSLRGAKGLTWIWIIEQSVKYKFGSDFHSHHSYSEFCQLLLRRKILMWFQFHVILRDVSTSVTIPFVTRILCFKQENISYLWSEVPCFRSDIHKICALPIYCSKMENPAALV